jgi:hypothetical protein
MSGKVTSKKEGHITSYIPHQPVITLGEENVGDPQKTDRCIFQIWDRSVVAIPNRKVHSGK